MGKSLKKKSQKTSQIRLHLLKLMNCGTDPVKQFVLSLWKWLVAFPSEVISNPAMLRGRGVCCPFGVAQRDAWWKGLVSAPPVLLDDCPWRCKVGSMLSVRYCGYLATLSLALEAFTETVSDAIFHSLEVGTQGLWHMWPEVLCCFGSCWCPGSQHQWQSWGWSSGLPTPPRSSGCRVVCHNALCYRPHAARVGCPHLHVLQFLSSGPCLRSAGMGLGRGTGAPRASSSAKQETGRVVPPVHAKLRASGSFIHALVKLAFDIYVSLSSPIRSCLKWSAGGLSTGVHTWVHTRPRSHTQPSPMSGEMAHLYL